MSDVIWERRDCVSAPVEGSLVLLDLDSLVYHSLNVTAADIWELLEEPRDEASIVSAVCRRYKIGEAECSQSVHKLLATLAASSLVKPKETSSETAA